MGPTGCARRERGAGGRGRGLAGRLTPRCCLERWIMGRRAIANLKPRTVGDTRQPNLANGSAEPPPSPCSRPPPPDGRAQGPTTRPVAARIP